MRKKQKSEYSLGAGSRREFLRDACLGSTALVKIAQPQKVNAADPPPTPTDASSTWAARLSSDRRHLELSYRGELWVTGMRVAIKFGGAEFSSDAQGAQLEIAPGGHTGETLVQARGPLPFTIALEVANSTLTISVRGMAGGEEDSALVEAELHAGPEPIQARLEDADDDVLQMACGQAASGLNNAVFDRFRDMALQVWSRQTSFEPMETGFRLRAGNHLNEAAVCRLEIVHDVYARRLPFYAPLDKTAWPHAPAGWCSWYRYFAAVTEDEILENARAVARDYQAFGLRYCLIDSGWQVAGGGENNGPIGGSWTEANTKFPHGMKWLADQIKAQGLQPGLWLSVFGNADRNFYNIHPDWFLHDENGNAKMGSWFGTYVADFSNPELIKFLSEVYRQHTLAWGFEYFKLDGENDTRDLWAKNRIRAFDPSLPANEAFRDALRVIREAMNAKPGVFFSACGPEYPTESMGIAQAARLGGDVVGDGESPSFRGVRTALAATRRGYYTHNIAWYADPDVLVVRPPLTRDEAVTWTSILGLSGQLLMLGDDMTSLPEDRREMLRKVIPVADIHPMELYPLTKDRHIWVLHVVRPYGRWAVAGLFNWDCAPGEMPSAFQGGAYEIETRNEGLLGRQQTYGVQEANSSVLAAAKQENEWLEALPEKPSGLELLPVPSYLSPPTARRVVLNFEKAGLNPEVEYLLYDFWNERFLGRVRYEFTAVLPAHTCQIISLRPFLGHPQLIGTDRHITMGAVELLDERWDWGKSLLHLTLKIVPNHPTTVSIYKYNRKLKNHSASQGTATLKEENEFVQVQMVSLLPEVTLLLEF